MQRRLPEARLERGPRRRRASVQPRRRGGGAPFLEPRPKLSHFTRITTCTEAPPAPCAESEEEVCRRDPAPPWRRGAAAPRRPRGARRASSLRRAACEARAGRAEARGGARRRGRERASRGGRRTSRDAGVVGWQSATRGSACAGGASADRQQMHPASPRRPRPSRCFLSRQASPRGASSARRIRRNSHASRLSAFRRVICGQVVRAFKC